MDYSLFIKRCQDIHHLENIISIIEDNSVRKISKADCLRTLSNHFEALNFDEGCIKTTYFRTKNEDLFSYGFWNMMTFYHHWYTENGVRYHKFTNKLNSKFGKVLKRELLHTFKNILKAEFVGISKFPLMTKKKLNEIKNWIKRPINDVELIELVKDLMQLECDIVQKRQRYLHENCKDIFENLDIEFLKESFYVENSKDPEKYNKLIHKLKEKDKFDKFKEILLKSIDTFCKLQNFPIDRQIIEKIFQSELSSCFSAKRQLLEKQKDDVKNSYKNAQSFVKFKNRFDRFQYFTEKRKTGSIFKELNDFCENSKDNILETLLNPVKKKYYKKKETIKENYLNTLSAEAKETNREIFGSIDTNLYQNKKLIPKRVLPLLKKIGKKLKNKFRDILKKDVYKKNSFMSKVKKVQKYYEITEAKVNFSNEYDKLKRTLQGLCEHQQLKEMIKIYPDKDAEFDDSLLSFLVQSRESSKFFISEFCLLQLNVKNNFLDFQRKITKYRDYFVHKKDYFIYLKNNEEINTIENEIKGDFKKMMKDFKEEIKKRVEKIEKLLKKKNVDEIFSVLSYRDPQGCSLSDLIELTCYLKVIDGINSNKNTRRVSNFPAGFDYKNDICEDIVSKKEVNFEDLKLKVKKKRKEKLTKIAKECWFRFLYTLYMIGNCIL